MILPGFFETLKQLQFPRKWILSLLGIQLLAVLFEGIGIGMLLPILEYMSHGGAPERELSGISELMIGMLRHAGIEPTLLALLSTCFCAILIRQVFFYFRELYSGYIDYELSRRIRNRAFERFVFAGLSYHDKIRGGDFVNELTTELRGALSCIVGATQFLGYVMLFAAYSAVAIGLSTQLTLVAIAVFSIAAGILLYFIRQMREMGNLVTRANQETVSFLVERLRNVRLIRLSGVERAEMSMLSDRTLLQRQHEMRRRKAFAVLAVVVEPVILLVAFVLLYLAIERLDMQFETILLFFFILIRLVPIMKEMLYTRQSYIGNLASAEVITNRLTSLDAYRDPEGGDAILEDLTSGIEFKDVYFTYKGQSDDQEKFGTKALKGVTLTIPASKMTALVGPSGSGKSTMVDLIPRLRVPDTGTILFDGCSHDEFNVASLRAAVSYAPQQPQLFNVSIADHIRYGKPDASIDEVRDAARLANAEGFIRALPDGFNTMLGDDGAKLSGGQRQRIDLARALVRRVPILVLDEPTSSLDAESESLFRESLEAIRRETTITIVLIGHRLKTVSSSDQIAVLMEGKIESVGTHDELMRLGGWYASAYKSQTG